MRCLIYFHHQKRIIKKVRRSGPKPCSHLSPPFQALFFWLRFPHIAAAETWNDALGQRIWGMCSKSLCRSCSFGNESEWSRGKSSLLRIPCAKRFFSGHNIQQKPTQVRDSSLMPLMEEIPLRTWDDVATVVTQQTFTSHCTGHRIWITGEKMTIPMISGSFSSYYKNLKHIAFLGHPEKAR